MSLDAADIDAIAERVLARLQDQLDGAPVRYIDAAMLASVLGVDRAWVYAHANELQAVRLGGARGRLRFDLDLVLRSLHGRDAAAALRARRRPRTKVMQVGADLLPIDP